MSNKSSNTPLSEEGVKKIKINKNRLELAVYLLLLVATGLYAREAMNLPSYGSSGSIGASGFPLLVSMLIGTSLILLIVVNLLNRPSQESELFIEVDRPLQVLLTVIVMAAVVLTLADADSECNTLTGWLMGFHGTWSSARSSLLSDI